MSIATVVAITGQAFARDGNNNLRELSIGDTLQEGETLVTSENGSAQLDFNDGLPATTIGSNEEVAMGGDVDADNPPTQDESATQDAELEALLGALEEEDGDLLELLEATAAGGGGAGGGGGDGASFVQLARITESVEGIEYDYEGSIEGGPTTAEFAALDAEEEAEEVTEVPTSESTEVLTEAPIEAPTEAPIEAPTEVPTEAPIDIEASITIDVIAGDDVLNADEADETNTTITGTVGGDVAAGDEVTLSVNNTSYTGNVVDDGNGNLTYSIEVLTDDLEADNSIDASVTATDAAGNSQEATASRDITVDTDIEASITIDVIAGDDVLNADEADETNTTITGTVGGDVAAGDEVTLSVNNTSYTGNVVDDGNGNLTYSIEVLTDDLEADNSIDASVTATDAAGNSQEATASRDITVDTDIEASITIDVIAGDDVLNADEADETNTTITGTVGGDVAAGDEVTLSVNNTSYTGNVVDDGNGNLTYSIEVLTDDLEADNSIDASVTATDAAGNSQEATASRDITVDTDIEASITIDVIAGDDVLNADEADETNTTITGTVGGDVAAGDEVTLSVNNTSYTGNVVDDGNGNLTYSIEVLTDDLEADNSIDASVTATDAAGNSQEATASRDITVDTDIEASITIDVIAGDDVLNADEADETNTTITGTVGGDVAAGDEVTLSVNNTSYTGNVVDDGNGNLTYSIEVLTDDLEADNSIDASVTATDAAGNSQEATASRDITVDTDIEASITIDVIAGDDVLNADEADETNTTITGTVGGDVAAGDEVTLSVNNTSYTGNVVDDGNGNLTYSIEVLTDDLEADNSIDASVTATDAAGNSQEATASRDITVDTDIEASITIDVIAGDDVLNADEADETNTTITGTVGGDVAAGDEVTLSVNNTSYTGNVVDDGNGNLTYSIEVLTDDLEADNSIDASVTATDAAGNSQEATASRDITVDTDIEASITIDVIAGDDVLNADEADETNTTITGTVGGDVAAGDEVTLSVNNTSYTGNVVDDGNGNLTYSIEVLTDDLEADNSIDASVTATDAAGNSQEATASRDITVDTDIEASITIDVIAGDDVLNADEADETNTTITGTVGGDVAAGDEVTLSVNNTSYTGNVVDDGNGNLTYSIEVLTDDLEADNSIDASVTATDAAGNSQEATASRDITVDTDIEASITIDVIAGDDVLNADEADETNTTITGTVGGDVAAGDEVTLSVNNTSYTGNVVDDGNGNLTYSIEVLTDDLEADNSIDASVTATDAAGNSQEATASRDITVDTDIEASITIDVIAGDDVLNADEADETNTTITGTVGGDVAAGDEVTLSVNNTSYTGNVVDDGNGNLTYSIEVLTDDLEADNSIDASVTATDAAGNSQEATASRDITVDTDIEASITIDVIAGDDVLNADEADETNTTITGTVGGDVAAGDEVTLSVNNTSYTGNVVDDGNGNLTYSIEVLTDDLEADNSIDASVTATDAAGNSQEATASRDITVDTNTAPIAYDDPSGTPYSITLGNLDVDGSKANWNNDDSTGNKVTITGYNNDGSTGTISYSEKVEGVSGKEEGRNDNYELGVSGSPRDMSAWPSQQIEYDVKTQSSEAISLQFNGNLNQATVGVQHLIANESGGEVGKWVALYQGTEVAAGEFNSSSFNIDTGDKVFDEVRFEALEYTNQGQPTGDSSDYFIDSFTGTGPANANTTYTTAEDETLSIDTSGGVITNDVDQEGDALHVFRINGTEVSSGNNISLASGALLTINSDGSFAYNPNGAFDDLDAGEVETDTFTYAIKDEHGNWLETVDGEGPNGDADSVATATITIIGKGDEYVPNTPSPTAADDVVSTNEDTTYTFSVADFGDDTSADDIQAIKLLSLPDNGTLELNGTAVDKNQVINTTDIGSLVFTPNEHTDVDSSLTFQVQDVEGNWSNSGIVFTTDIYTNAVADTPVVTLTVGEPEMNTKTEKVYSGYTADAYNGNNFYSGNLSNGNASLKFNSVNETAIETDYGIGVQRNSNESEAGIDDNETLVVNLGETTRNASFDLKTVEGSSSIDGSWSIFDANGDQIEAPTDFTLNGDGVLNITSNTPFMYVAFEGHSSGSGASDNGYFVDPKSIELDGLTVDLSQVGLGQTVEQSSGVESLTYSLDLSANLVDTDGSETLSIDITGIPDGATLSGATQNADGSWTVTVDENADQFDGNLTLTVPAGAEDFTLEATATATESNPGTNDETVTTATASSTAAADVVVPEVVVDQLPEAEDESQDLVVKSSDIETNLTFIVDVSSSMSNEDLSLSEEAIDSIVQQYGAIGNVNVNVIQFWGNNAEQTGWQSTDSLTVELHDDKSGTDPEQGLRMAVESYDGSQPQADQDIVFFMGDGDPYNNNSVDYKADYEAFLQTWQSFANNTVDEVKVFGINVNSLDIADEIVSKNETPIYVEDIGDFADLVSNIDVEPEAYRAVGQLFDNVSGGDGDISIDAIQVGGQTYQASDFADGNTISIDGQGKLSIDFSTGEYRYTVSSDEISEDTDKQFTVTVSDEDGDAASFDVNIDVKVQAPEVPEESGEKTFKSSEKEILEGGETVSYKLGGLTNAVTVKIFGYKESGNGNKDNDGEIQLLKDGEVVETIDLDEVFNGNSQKQDVFRADNGASFDEVVIENTDDNQSFTVESVLATIAADESPLQNGTLVDGIVEGLAYTTASGLTGLTDDAGAFNYREGDSVTFMVGDVVVGSATPEDLAAGKVFLQDLADVSRSDLNDEYVENMAVFLQSLDEDGNADNGITISASDHAAFEGVSLNLKTASEAEVKAAIESASQYYVDEEEAMAHVQRMLEKHGGQTEFDAHVDDSIVTATLAHDTIDGLRYETSSGLSGEMVEGQFEYDAADTIELFVGDQRVASFSAEEVGDDGVISFDEAGFIVSREELDTLLSPQEASEADGSDEPSETELVDAESTEVVDASVPEEGNTGSSEDADSETSLIGDDEEPLFTDDESPEESEPVDTEAEVSTVASDAGENQQEGSDQEESVQENTQEGSSESVDNDSLTSEELLNSGEEELFKDEEGAESSAQSAKVPSEKADVPTYVTTQQDELNTSINSVD